MAFIKVTVGPEWLAGKEIRVSANPQESEAVFMELAKRNCFWEVNLSDLSNSEAYDMKIIDFATRCARSICMRIPIFIDNQQIIVLNISKKSVDNALRRVTNLLAVSGGNMRIAKDDKQGLKIEIVPNVGGDDFAEGMVFANA
ncbi:MAG: hypothetical protein US70_C0004G0009 [Parcubacteria group bacterium GW2011_GWD2_38_11]|nr:MAG: hypothetical protein US70_C0004G0009 [Parcubacteria group bacterium GW2011_GWD2_38_11]